jgi:CheY-like chemotaxis protein
VKKTLHWVQDGLQALDFLRRRGKYAGAVRPDIIVLDLNLPKLSGRELLAQIKADERLKSVPVIVLTTSRADDDVRAAYGLHANCYITKPADLDRFLAIVKLIDHFWLDVVTLPAMRGEDTA